MRYKLVLLIFIYISSATVAKTTSTIDSLNNAFANAKTSPQRLPILKEITNYYSIHLEIDSLQKYALLYLRDASILHKPLAQIEALDKMAFSFASQEKRKETIDFLNKELSIALKNKYVQKQATIYLGICNNYASINEFEKSIAAGEKAMNIYKKLNDEKGIATTNHNLGYAYSQIEMYDVATKYFMQSINICKKHNFINDQAHSYQGLGFIFYSKGDMQKAFWLYKESVKLFAQTTDYNGYTTSLNNLASSYENQGDFDNALIYYKQTLTVLEKTNFVADIANVLYGIASVYDKKGNHNEAIQFYKKSLSIVENRPAALDLVRDIYFELYSIYKKTGNNAAALLNYEHYTILHDSLSKQHQNIVLIRKEFEIKYEKKAEADSINAAEEKRVQSLLLKAKEKELTQERALRYSLFLGFVAILGFVILLLNRFRIIRRQKEIIEKQKTIVDAKNEEIIASIIYAQRIQQALLASDSLLQKHWKQYFVFYRPKDIVSGDFYWATNKNDKFYFILADSTGHGVPGAFMSLLNISYINEAITERNIEEPEEILNYVKSKLLVSLKTDGSLNGGQDGMDATLLVFDKRNNILKFASANQALLLLRNEKLTKFDGDKMPVGRSPKDSFSFTQQTIELIAGDKIYLYTDGFADQFGGPQGKKYKYKQLEELLFKTSTHSISEQQLLIATEFDTWKGEQEQIDDVLLVGIVID